MSAVCVWCVCSVCVCVCVCLQCECVCVCLQCECVCVRVFRVRVCVVCVCVCEVCVLGEGEMRTILLYFLQTEITYHKCHCVIEYDWQ